MKIGIHGLGLEGAGLGMEIRARFGDRAMVSGYDEAATRRRAAHSAGAVDLLAANIPELAAADIVFVCDEGQGVADAFKALAPQLAARTAVSYVGRVQASAAEMAAALLPDDASYIGSHPGQAAAPGGTGGKARPVWCLMPSRQASADALGKIRDVAIELGYRPLLLTADEHDRYVAATEHLPLLIRAALLDVVLGSAGWRDLEPFAAGLAPTSPLERIQPADLVANSGSIVHWLDRAIEALSAVRGAVAAGSQDEIKRLLDRLDEHEARLTRPAADGDERPRMRSGVIQSLLGDRVAKLIGRGQ